MEVEDANGNVQLSLRRGARGEQEAPRGSSSMLFDGEHNTPMDDGDGYGRRGSGILKNSDGMKTGK